ncbi:hypothetical protein L6452_01941 [Arctium lappa]|uniref:Uncharacterized protein n=1 Tax=Arctium lappa TaxID=4217 RepID=A0ACB9FI96_ARCLA|nr:hypothetical protein L6452_01941 [Arctium lappa]
MDVDDPSTQVPSSSSAKYPSFSPDYTDSNSEDYHSVHSLDLRDSFKFGVFIKAKQSEPKPQPEEDQGSNDLVKPDNYLLKSLNLGEDTSSSSKPSHFPKKNSHLPSKKPSNLKKGKSIVSDLPLKRKMSPSSKVEPHAHSTNGCSRHMTGNKSLLIDYVTKKGPTVTFGDNSRGSTRGYGTLSNGSITFNKVAYVEGLMHNLLSIKDFMKKNCLWHKRLSHLNFKTLNALSNKDLVVGMPKLSFVKEKLCATCEKGKLTKSSFKTKKCFSTSTPLQMLHMELCGPVSTPSLEGKRNSTLESFFDDKGIPQNFDAVRMVLWRGKNRTLCEASRSMLSESNLPT